MNYTTTIVLACTWFGAFLYFMNKLFQINRTSREILPFLGVALILLCGSISYFLVDWFDFYNWVGGGQLFDLFKISQIFGLSGSLAQAFLAEFVLKKTKYIISIYTLVGIAVSIPISDFNLLNTILLVFVAPIYLSVVLLWYFTFLKPTSGFLRQRMTLAVWGVIIFALGVLLRNKIVVDPLGLYIFSVGTMIGVGGVALIAYGFSAFSTFTDLKWKEKMRELFVISNNGICLFAFSFEKQMPLVDSDLIAGGFSGIQLLLSEMMKTKENLQLINYQNLKIMLEQGSSTVIVLIVKEESRFLQYKLKIFSQEFENFFKDILKEWRGQIDAFKPTSMLINRIFEL